MLIEAEGSGTQNLAVADHLAVLVFMHLPTVLFLLAF